MNWKKITGYDKYSISDCGEVRNDITGRILKPSTSRTGYSTVTLSQKGKTRSHYIHRLVMNEFNPNPKPDVYTDVNHIDFNKANNTLENLEWTTHAYNKKWGSVPVSIDYIAEEIKDICVIVLNKYLTNHPEATENISDKIKHTAINQLIYQQRNL